MSDVVWPESLVTKALNSAPPWFAETLVKDTVSGRVARAALHHYMRIEDAPRHTSSMSPSPVSTIHDEVAISVSAEPECRCKSLLIGHDPNCNYIRSKK